MTFYPKCYNISSRKRSHGNILKSARIQGCLIHKIILQDVASLNHIIKRPHPNYHILQDLEVMIYISAVIIVNAFNAIKRP